MKTILWMISFPLTMQNEIDKSRVENKSFKMELKLKEAKNYVKNHDLNKNYCILIDFSVHSGLKRMYLYQLSNDSLIRSDVVTHGICDNYISTSDTGEVRYSNQPNSHCSSLGKYSIGIRSYSSWGIHVHYKLHGLEDSNNNAYERIIVFHSWEAVSEEEIFPYSSPLSWGCPAVSNNTMRYYDALLKKEKKMLMWIFED